MILKPLLLSLILTGILPFSENVNASDLSFKRTVIFPSDSSGWTHGTAGAFIGSFGEDQEAYIAGGSDFLDLRPWEGGKKTFFDTIWKLERKDGRYSVSPIDDVKLPLPLGQGCCVSQGNVIYIIGGLNAEGYSDAIFALRKDGASLSIDRIASLPEGFHPSAAAYHKGMIFMHGDTNGANAFFSFSPGSKVFRELPRCPANPLVEGSSLCVQNDGKEDALFLIGGRNIGADGLFVSENIWKYTPSRSVWEKKCQTTFEGKSMGIMYASATAYGSAHILVFGGDDGVEMKKRLALEKGGDKEGLANAFAAHPGFQPNVFAYHTVTDTWTLVGTADSPLPAVTSVQKMGECLILPSGESRPGVRSNEVIEVIYNNQPSFGLLNYIIVFIYLLGMLGIGFLFSRKNRGSDSFFKGGGKIPWWAAGISIFATSLSAITFLSIPAKAYSSDWGMFVFNMAIILVVPLVIHFYLPLIKKLKVASVYQYLEDRFSPSMKYLASSFFCLFMLARIAIILFLPSLALNAVTGINIYVCILLMGIVTIIYCTMGGIEAVVWGDVIQGFILVSGAILSLVFIITHIDGGVTSYFSVAADNNKFNALNFSFDWTQPVFWVALIGGLANQFLTYTSDQSVVQKYLTVKDKSSAERGLWLNGFLSIPITLLFFGIGTGLFVFFKQHPNLLNIGMSNTDSIFPHYIMCQLPKGVAGLLIAAVFAAAMSTLSSNINSSTTVMSEDFFSHIKKNCTDEHKVKFARISGIMVGGLGLGMALVLASISINSLWDQFNFFLGLLTSGLGGLFAMGVFTKRIGTRSAYTGYFGSFILLIICSRYTSVSPTLYGFLGLVSCFVIGYASSFIFGKGK